MNAAEERLIILCTHISSALKVQYFEFNYLGVE